MKGEMECRSRDNYTLSVQRIRSFNVILLKVTNDATHMDNEFLSNVKIKLKILRFGRG